MAGKPVHNKIPYSEDQGRIIRDLLHDGYTRRGIAKKLGISRPTLYDWLRNETLTVEGKTLPAIYADWCAANEIALRGQPKMYTEDIGLQLCDSVERGESMRAIAEKFAVTLSELYDWIHDDRNRVGRHTLAERYALARDRDADRIADRITELSEIAAKMTSREDRPDGLRVALQGLQWLAAVRAPRKYNPRIAEQDAIAASGFNFTVVLAGPQLPQAIRVEQDRSLDQGPLNQIGTGQG